MELQARKQLEDKFSNSLGSGTGALRYVSDAIDSVAASGDTTILRNFIVRAKNKSDDKAAASVRFIVSKVWPDAKFSVDKNKVPVIKIAGCAISNSARETLNSLVISKASLRGTMLTKAFAGETTDPTRDELVAKAKKYFTNLVNKTDDNDKQLVTFAILRAALDAAEKEAQQAK